MTSPVPVSPALLSAEVSLKWCRDSVFPPLFPPVIPRSGARFPPRGPSGSVPPLPQYYQALRLPTVHPAALRFLRLAVLPLRSVLRSQWLRTPGHWAWGCSTVSPHRSCRETIGPPRFLGNPLC